MRGQASIVSMVLGILLEVVVVLPVLFMAKDVASSITSSMERQRDVYFCSLLQKSLISRNHSLEFSYPLVKFRGKTAELQFMNCSLPYNITGAGRGKFEVVLEFNGKEVVGWVKG